MEQGRADAWSEARVIAIIRDLAGVEELPARLATAEISGADSAETLGLDSIGAFALVDRLEAEVGVPLPDDFVGLGDSVTVMAQRLNEVAEKGG